MVGRRSSSGCGEEDVNYRRAPWEISSIVVSPKLELANGIGTDIGRHGDALQWQFCFVVERQ